MQDVNRNSNNVAKLICPKSCANFSSFYVASPLFRPVCAIWSLMRGRAWGVAHTHARARPPKRRRPTEEKGNISPGPTLFARAAKCRANLMHAFAVSVLNACVRVHMHIWLEWDASGCECMLKWNIDHKIYPSFYPFLYGL